MTRKELLSLLWCLPLSSRLRSSGSGREGDSPFVSGCAIDPALPDVAAIRLKRQWADIQGHDNIEGGTSSQSGRSSDLKLAGQFNAAFANGGSDDNRVTILIG